MRLILCVPLLTILSLAVNAAVPNLKWTNACCPNGTYTDNLHLACLNGENYYYGDGQCYDSNWQIQCSQTFNSADMITMSFLQTRATGQIWFYDTCYEFCKANATGFTAINIQPGEVGICQCLRLASNSIDYAGDLSAANSMVQCPQNDCCKRYHGDISTACTNDASNAQGKCISVHGNPFIINCNAISYKYNTSYSAEGINNLSDCLHTCNQNAANGFNAVMLQLESESGSCSCGNSESSFVANYEAGNPLYSLYQTPFQFCH